MSYAFFIFSFFGGNSSGAVFYVADGDIQSLITAINTANSNGEADVIHLASGGTYIFTQPDHETFINSGGNPVSQGWTALPAIQNTDWPQQNTLDLVIEGNGATFVRNSSLFFRFIYVHTTAKVVIRNLNFQNGSGRHRGGAVFSGWRTSLTLENCRFSQNNTYGDQGTFDQGGGAVMISSEGSLTLSDCEFSDNSASGFGISLSGNGGGAVMCLLSNLSVSDCVFSGNSSSNFAGALYVDGGKADTGKIEVKNCVFTDNTAAGAAGAFLNYLYNSNTAVIENCRFEGNHSGAGHGGAIYSGGSVISHSGYTGSLNNIQVSITKCSFTGNSSSTRSGALYLNESHSEVENCTFSENQGGDFASAIFIGKKRLSCVLRNLTVARNGSETSQLKALFIAGDDPSSEPKVEISNCIFSENNAGHLGWNALPQILLSPNNLQFPGSEFGNTVPSADPLLLPPAFNGAFTKTMALQEGSPAIDAGSGCPATDQRGFEREGACDLGSFEYHSSPLSQASEDLPESDFLIYPNPSEGVFFIETEIPDDITVQITNSLGQILHSEKFYRGKSINVSHLPFGIYFVQVRSFTFNRSFKIIIR